MRTYNGYQPIDYSSTAPHLFGNGGAVLPLPPPLVGGNSIDTVPKN